MGGLVGASSSTLLNCYSATSVLCTGDYSAGGLVGTNEGIILNCYSLSSVSGDDYVGGLVGHNFNGSISNCYVAGYITGNSNVGSIVGYSDNASYTKCFWDSDVNPNINGIGNSSDPNVIVETTENMQKENTFTEAGWDFEEIWDIGENQTYPFLRQYPAGDLNHDGIVNFPDFAIFADHWLAGVE